MAGRVFYGTDEIVDRWLGLDDTFRGKVPRFPHASTLNRLCDAHLPDLDGLMLLQHLDRRIESNWLASQERSPRLPSQENWRWKKMLYIDEHSASREKTLEKAISAATNEDWVNQVPTASGLVHPGDSHCNIDLVHRTGSTYSFIELKVTSNTPLYAAIECVLYGIVYAMTRRRMRQLNFNAEKKPLLAATHIDLVVLAPRSYYRNWDLRWLHESISVGLRAYSQQLDYSFGFAFQSFPDDFNWNNSDGSELPEALRGRYSLYED